MRFFKDLTSYIHNVLGFFLTFQATITFTKTGSLACKGMVKSRHQRGNPMALSAATTTSHPESASIKTILIVEDDQTHRALMEEILQENGFWWCPLKMG